jgi:hypothetical protein
VLSVNKVLWPHARDGSSSAGKGMNIGLSRRVAVSQTASQMTAFGNWRPTEEGLCLTWSDRSEQCAPVFEVGFSRFRVGNMDLISQERLDNGPVGQPFERGIRRWDFGVPSP